MRTLKQQCFLWSVWLTGLGIPLLVIVIGVLHSWTSAIIVLLVTALGQFLYVRAFPRLSGIMGYGSVQDVPDTSTGSRPLPPSTVILYTASVCPFCPIVRQRLLQLQSKLGFALVEVDVTFRAHAVLSKGFRSVPVIEFEGRHWVGNATTAELSSFLRSSQPAPVT